MNTFQAEWDRVAKAQAKAEEAFIQLSKTIEANLTAHQIRTTA